MCRTKEALVRHICLTYSNLNLFSDSRLKNSTIIRIFPLLMSMTGSIDIFFQNWVLSNINYGLEEVPFATSEKLTVDTGSLPLIDLVEVVSVLFFLIFIPYNMLILSYCCT